MKEFLGKKILKLATKLTLSRNNYKIIAITGSSGKTSTKKAMGLVLSQKYKVLTNEDEGYNTEFGLPLVLLQKEIPKNFFGWVKLAFVAPFSALKKQNFDYAILEMGADKPGDIEYLIKMTRPNIAILTNVFESHLKDFKDLKSIKKEKEKIFSGLKKGELAVVNADDPYLSQILLPKGVKKMDYGKKAKNIKIVEQKTSTNGTQNIFNAFGKDLIINSKAVGEHLLYIFGAAIAVAISQKMDFPEIKQGLESFRPVKGRMSLIQGIKGSLVIDDSYNANPSSMKNAIFVLDSFQGRKIAALGSMNELGEFEKEAHEELGSFLAEKCDILVTVGEAAEKYLAKTAKLKMPNESVFSFSNSIDAGEFLKENIQKGDIILVKGSQNNIRMEKTVKMIMSDPQKAPELLCRQGLEWEGK